MSPRTARASRRPHRLLPAALAVALAAGAAGCGSDDDPSGETTGPTPTTTSAPSAGTTTGAPSKGSAGGADTGTPPADEAAIREALRRGVDETQRLRTARIAMTIDIGPLKTSAEGTADLVEQRYGLDQTVDQGGQKIRLRGYGEKGRVYVRIAGSDGWIVTENPVSGSDPLEQVRQLQKAEIVRVREVATMDGVRCRWFDSEVLVADAVGNARDPAVKQLLQGAPKGATVPLSACVDGRGLSFAFTQDYDPADAFGSAAAGAPRTSISARMSEYGTAKAPERPAGIDDAKPAPNAPGAPSVN